MRALATLLLSAAAALGLLACDQGATVLVLDARPSRAADRRVVVDVQLEAVEPGGRNVGWYCVSIHWFNFGFDPATPPAGRYVGELDFLEQCADDLRDGDQRTFRLVSHNTDLVKGMPARVQVRRGKGEAIDTMGIIAP
jgi:hypothetical protein